MLLITSQHRKNETLIPQHHYDFGTWSGEMNVIICVPFLFHYITYQANDYKKANCVQSCFKVYYFMGVKFIPHTINHQGTEETKGHWQHFYNQLQSELPMHSNWWTKINLNSCSICGWVVSLCQCLHLRSFFARSSSFNHNWNPISLTQTS